MGLAGLDFVLPDGEHGMFTRESIDDMCRVAELAGLTAIARVPDHSGLAGVGPVRKRRHAQGLGLPPSLAVVAGPDHVEAVESHRVEGAVGAVGQNLSLSSKPCRAIRVEVGEQVSVVEYELA